MGLAKLQPIQSDHMPIWQSCTRVSQGAVLHWLVHRNGPSQGFPPFAAWLAILRTAV
jgi:hypothetical protein